MLIFHLYPGFQTLGMLNATQAILPSPFVYPPLQTSKGKYVEYTISFEVCTIKVPLADCCLQILFGPMLRVTTTYISLCSYRAEMLKKYLARTVENVDCRYQMKSLYSIMHSEWSESANVVM